jgi:hypothetical protein
VAGIVICAAGTPKSRIKYVARLTWNPHDEDRVRRGNVPRRSPDPNLRALRLANARTMGDLPVALPLRIEWPLISLWRRKSTRRPPMLDAPRRRGIDRARFDNQPSRSGDGRRPAAIRRAVGRDGRGAPPRAPDLLA